MILLTGIAGFIGMHTALRLLASGVRIIGVDSMNSYYDPALKQARLVQLRPYINSGQLVFLEMDVAEPHALEKALKPYAGEITEIIHLAAQAGVRYSLEAPRTYIHANISGMMEILELARSHIPNLKHLVYASSSSVYGANRELPFSLEQRTDHPVSLYAATKKAGEVLAESYARLYKIPMTGLRFFTVYGPWGRPDMAYFKFTKAILAGETIQVYNHGDMRRDFTFVEDIVDGILAVTAKPQGAHRIYNLGNSRSEHLPDMIHLLEEYLGKKAVIEYLPMQAGDVQDTFADVSASTADFGFAPKTPLSEGLKPFVKWYREFYI